MARTDLDEGYALRVIVDAKPFQLIRYKLHTFPARWFEFAFTYNTKFNTDMPRIFHAIQDILTRNYNKKLRGNRTITHNDTIMSHQSDVYVFQSMTQHLKKKEEENVLFSESNSIIPIGGSQMTITTPWR